MRDFERDARRAKVAAIVRTLDGFARLNGIPVRGRQADTIAAADEATCRILCCGSVVAASREEAFAAAERARDATIAEAERWMRRAVR